MARRAVLRRSRILSERRKVSVHSGAVGACGRRTFKTHEERWRNDVWLRE